MICATHELAYLQFCGHGLIFDSISAQCREEGTCYEATESSTSLTTTEPETGEKVQSISFKSLFFN